ncbi:O-methyltransferase [Pollutibacter soli]|uniref:O-methyltransferase n=1 Tax=Pollutibacter soli TaxID=3034157 RepID=UPI003013ADA7
MEIIPARVEAYAADYTTKDDALLSEIAEYTLREHAEPHMLSGHLQGQLLTQLSRMIQPERILEIGTFTGYSAICLAKGLKHSGILHTIEKRPDDARLARSFFDRSCFGNQMIVHEGEAEKIIETLNETWDLAFIDADKINYVLYYELVMQKLRPGGWIIADNVLFHGTVLEENLKGKNAKAIHDFNRHVASDNRVEQVMITVRDGLTLIYKKDKF